jgi:1,4-dihydroxy-2-naphthoyl-CoA synthase
MATPEVQWTAWEVPAGLPPMGDILYERCTRSIGGSAARITINKPQVLNALTSRNMKEIMVAVDVANRAPSVGVVALQDAGDRAFCTGGDVKWCGFVLDGSPTCIRILKAVFDQEVDEMAGDVRRAAHMIHPNFVESEEAHEAQRAFFEKRPPNFWPKPT